MAASWDISQFVAGLDKAQQLTRKAAADALDQFSEHVLGDAQKLCPVKTGTLKASDEALPVIDDGQMISQTIGFNTSYAAAVHERLDLHHTTGQAKYLSTAMNANAPQLGAFVQKAIAEVLK